MLQTGKKVKEYVARSAFGSPHSCPQKTKHFPSPSPPEISSHFGKSNAFGTGASSRELLKYGQVSIHLPKRGHVNGIFDHQPRVERKLATGTCDMQKYIEKQK